MVDHIFPESRLVNWACQFSKDKLRSRVRTAMISLDQSWSSIIDKFRGRDETGPTRNWLKWAVTSCNCNIWKAVPEQQRPPSPRQGSIFSLDLHWSQWWQNLDQNWLKLANWLRSHIPVEGRFRFFYQPCGPKNPPSPGRKFWSARYRLWDAFGEIRMISCHIYNAHVVKRKRRIIWNSGRFYLLTG